ncbi:hypothetical protein D3C80_376060 [compost metagenome]
MLHRLIHLFGQRLQGIFGGERPQRGALIQRIADLHLTERLGKLAQEALGDFFVQDKTLRRGTNLTGIVEPRLYASLHRLVEAGIIQHHKDIVAAQLKGRFLNVLRRLRRHDATRFFRAG